MHPSYSTRRVARIAPFARTVFAALSVAALLGACAIPKHPDAEAPAPDPFNPAATQLLDDTSWVLTGWKQPDGTARTIPFANLGAPITLTLSTARGQRHASGFSGCNRYMGSYSLKDGKLSFGTLGGTRMACATPGGQIESSYLSALTHIERTGVQMREPQQMQLVLDNGDTLVFERGPK
ncbi:META domain-containing protein [Paraburkholderia kirstenboschensis]|uniref:META domain-containing protein n=1 Tax=Paraburkholderia kirstenboschensis TaxID=1245436 RepID=A0ABZ0EQP7_9BURK|nr:META domain-containing protein [Paraburkholderia kirstenboschensis]WOD18921.1 META domain-containing protein [Paraburkholderia kirstenboschensis]